MRKFALVVLDAGDKIEDRIGMDIVTNLGGLGYRLEISTIKTDVEDYVTKIIQQKKQLNLTQIYRNGYQGMEAFNSWVLKNINNTVCLEYDDGSVVKYCEVKIIDSSYSEINQYRVLEQVLTMQPLTPFFVKIENKIRIQISSEGKYYPFKYPYTYGTNIIENNEINNVYFKEVPIIVNLYGPLENPRVTLLDENDEIYNEVLFDDVFVEEGQILIINSAQKKIWLVDENGNYEDYYYKLNGAYDSYLRAIGLTKSKININIGAQKGYLVGSWRQYKL